MRKEEEEEEAKEEEEEEEKDRRGPLEAKVSNLSKLQFFLDVSFRGSFSRPRAKGTRGERGECTTHP